MTQATMLKGRGPGSTPPDRFATRLHAPGACGTLEPEPPSATVEAEHGRSAIAYNRWPGLPFDRALNPYRGCEHGGVACYARPSPICPGLSCGPGSETRLVAMPDRLRRELARPGYAPCPLAIGTVADPYPPVERRFEITRRTLEVLAGARHPAVIVTKSVLVLRDLDLLKRMAADGLVEVAVSLTSLDPAFSRRLEPRAAAPHRRLETLAMLAKAGVPASVGVSPVIPGLNDHLIEPLLERARAAGATGAWMGLIRLPRDAKGLFAHWLNLYYPLKSARVLALIRSCRGERLSDPAFGVRMTGAGRCAESLHRRFERARRRLELEDAGSRLRTDLFRRPGADQMQMDLFA